MSSSTSGAAGDRHWPAEADFHPDRLAAPVAAAARCRAGEGDAGHGRRDHPAAVHLAAGGGGHRGVGQHRVRGAVGRGLDGGAVAAQGAGRDADAVRVQIRLLHRVGERGGDAEADRGERRGPAVVADRQRHLRVAGHRHRPVELHPHRDGLAPYIGVAGSRSAGEGDAAHDRRGGLAIHLAAGGGGHGAMGQHRVRGAAGVLDRPAVEAEGVGRDADSVEVAVARLNRVAEGDLGVAAVRGGVGRLPGVAAHAQRHLRRAGHGHRFAEPDRYLDRLPVLVVLPARRRAGEVDEGHQRPGDLADSTVRRGSAASAACCRSASVVPSVAVMVPAR